MPPEWLHIILFEAKRGGGHRPIANLVSALKVWSRLRHDAQWEAEHPADFFWGVAGRPCDSAGWSHNLYEEAATGLGEATASFFGDIDKFYENISHTKLWQEGMATGFPPPSSWP